MTEDVPYSYTVEVLAPEQRTKHVLVTKFEDERVPYTYNVTIAKPETRTRKVFVTVQKITLYVVETDGRRRPIEFRDGPIE